MILVYGLFALIFAFAIMGFSTDVFAEEIVIQKPLVRADDSPIGSMIRTQTVSGDGSI